MDEDRRAQIEEADAIREVLDQLKKKERHLRDKLERTNEEGEREKLTVKIDVCHAQRKKGLAILKAIKASG
jgi:hypothetical protein